jgi:hypothetical protein
MCMSHEISTGCMRSPVQLQAFDHGQAKTKSNYRIPAYSYWWDHVRIRRLECSDKENFLMRWSFLKQNKDDDHLQHAWSSDITHAWSSDRQSHPARSIVASSCRKGCFHSFPGPLFGVASALRTCPKATLAAKHIQLLCEFDKLARKCVLIQQGIWSVQEHRSCKWNQYNKIDISILFHSSSAWTEDMYLSSSWFLQSLEFVINIIHLFISATWDTAYIHDFWLYYANPGTPHSRKHMCSQKTKGMLENFF